MVLGIIALIIWEGIKFYFWILSWIVSIWAKVLWNVHLWYVKGMAYVFDRTSSPSSPEHLLSNGHKRRAIEMEEQTPETSGESIKGKSSSLENTRPIDGTGSATHVPTNSFRLAAFAACFEAVENLRRRDALIGVRNEELIQMLTEIIRGGRDLYSVRIPWPPFSDGEGGRRNGVSSYRREGTPLGTTDWETIYSQYRKRSTSGEGGETEGANSDASKARSKSPEYVDNLNKVDSAVEQIHASITSLHAIVDKTKAEKEELMKIKSSASSTSTASLPKDEKEAKKVDDKSTRVKIEESEKKKDEKDRKEVDRRLSSIDDLFDDGSDDDLRGSVPPAAKKRKEETREEKRKRKDEERKKKK
ncbi:hypothetical protein PMAYCL1PPCAC_07372, partial [Pristionchus mayeri]